MTASNKSKTVHLTYHHEDGSWWAESHQLPGLFAGGDSLDEAKTLARQVVADEIGRDVTLAEWMPVPAALERFIGASDATHAPTSKTDEPTSTSVEDWAQKETPSKSVEPELVQA